MTQEAKMLLGVGIVTILLILGVFFFGGNTQKGQPVSNIDTRLLIRDDSPKISTNSAKVTIVEFGDYQCPACKIAFPVVNQILKDYKGQASFVFRHFPLPQHQNAFVASAVAEAAGEQGKYFDMHDKLYENQNEWADESNAQESFLKYAQELKLNLEQFKNSLTSNKFQEKINRDKNDGNSLGINSTPTFFLNGKKLNLQNPNDLKAVVEQAIKNE